MNHHNARIGPGNIYVYKMTCDNGGAPCVHRKLLSLAICKPRIRTGARVGDWIVGFGGASIPELREKLIYVAKVTAVERDGGYYKTARYSGRPDCIYEGAGNGYRYREGSKYHSADDLAHDLGSAPRFERAVTLLSEEFRYFGDAAERPLIGSIQEIYAMLPRDFRKNHDASVRNSLEAYIIEALDFPRSARAPKPIHGDKRMKCSTPDDEDFLLVGSCSG